MTHILDCKDSQQIVKWDLIVTVNKQTNKIFTYLYLMNEYNGIMISWIVIQSAVVSKD